MGIFGWIKGLIFKKKKEPEPIEDTGPEDLGPLTPLREEREGLTPTPLAPREPYPPTGPMAPPRAEPERGEIETSNLKAKVDLLLTKIEHVSLQNKTIDERLKAIEKKLTEMKQIRYY